VEGVEVGAAVVGVGEVGGAGGGVCNKLPKMAGIRRR